VSRHSRYGPRPKRLIKARLLHHGLSELGRDGTEVARLQTAAKGTAGPIATPLWSWWPTATGFGHAAGLGFKAHQHMLRHACGYTLANKGRDTRAIQAYLGHRNIQHTVRYTELSPHRFKGFWR
jgi:integrase